MQIASLGSGSKGNGTLVNLGDTTVLIDCGFSLKQFKLRLERLALSPEDIDAVLVTHEHSDHSGGVARLASSYKLPIWSTRGTARCAFDEDFTYHDLRGGQQITIGSLEILPVTVPHDAGEPVQFIFMDSDNGKKLGILTDAGHITSHIADAYKELDGLLLEFNYDEVMLEQGPYPFFLKQRVGGDLGHLSNTQSMSLLRQIDKTRLNCLIAGHISENNNCRNLVAEQLGKLEGLPEPVLADQETGFGWIDI